MSGLLLFIVLLLCAVLLFINFYPPFGGSASKAKKAEYALRAENYFDGTFHNIGAFTLMSEADDPYKDRTSGKGRTPSENSPS